MQQTTEDLIARPAGVDTPPRWPTPLVLAHWSTVALLALGVTVIYGREAAEARALREALLGLHRWVGVLVWVACWARLAMRLLGRPPARLRATRGWLAWAAATMHALLYALLLAVPLLGWALSSARGQVVAALGLSLPMAIGPDPDLADELAAAHNAAALTLLALVLVHALAAAWHHYVRRDNVLASMSITRSKAVDAPAPPQADSSSPPVRRTS